MNIDLFLETICMVIMCVWSMFVWWLGLYKLNESRQRPGRPGISHQKDLIPRQTSQTLPYHRLPRKGPHPQKDHHSALPPQYLPSNQEKDSQLVLPQSRRMKGQHQRRRSVMSS